MPVRSSAVILLAALASVGCAVAPGDRSGGSVTHDVADYFAREWPLAGPPVIPPDAEPHECGACARPNEEQPGPLPAPLAAKGCAGRGCPLTGRIGAQKATLPDPPPATPLAPGGPGRFFPVPTAPAFAPQTGWGPA